MDIKKLTSLGSYSAEKMKKINVFSTPRVMTDLYCLEPGQAQKAHAHEGEDKIYFIVEGSGSVQVGSDTRNIGSGEIVIAPAGINHGITNGDGGRMQVLVFMAPNAHFEGGHGGHAPDKGHDHGHKHGGHGHDHGPGGHQHGGHGPDKGGHKHGGGCGC
ncbi:MAG: cupin domain-containing protein [Nitrospirota bacterium]|nr:cupin domain-containing protein [Nitrospirota bacterium]